VQLSRWLVVLTLLAAGGVACTSDPEAAPVATKPPVAASAASTIAATEPRPATTPSPPSPAEPAAIPIDDPFFDAAGAAPGQPGDVIRARTIDLGDPSLQAWQVLVWSRDVRDEPIAVSGVVIAPTAPATGPRPVLSWAHGTTGMGDACAPSRAWATGNAPERSLLPLLQQAGWVFAATDYQGLGTPGDHTYVVGLAEGRNVLDIARAAERLEGTGATSESPVLVWGHSQGGGAAAFAAELAPTYAPELDVVGAIAGAPAAELSTDLADIIDAGPYAGFRLMVTVGFLAAYPELAGSATLTPEAQAMLDDVRDGCVRDILDQFAGQSTQELIPPDVTDLDAIDEVLQANTAGHVATEVPILLYHGDDDEVIPAEISARLLDRYCALGVTVERRTYPGTDHVSVIAAALPDLVAYATARVNGEPAPTSCP
jgi:pimeloyl-ACP methyl ester carboxylesterase